MDENDDKRAIRSPVPIASHDFPVPGGEDLDPTASAQSANGPTATDTLDLTAARRSRPLPEGYRFEEGYTIERELESDGFAIRYLARHDRLGSVVIKEFLPAGVARRDSAAEVQAVSRQYDALYAWGLHRFLDEARLLGRFQHPNIVGVQDYFEANNTAYVVMDDIKARSLQTVLDGGRRFDEQQLRWILYPLLDALRTSHDHDLLHRNISPDTILLRELDDSPVLIDFGSARYQFEMRASDVAPGQGATTSFTPGYSAIEQYEGTEQGPYTDIYALGATLYRTALNTQPVDALKRAEEIRLQGGDPLEPAVPRGKDRYSEAFLLAIDTALQLEADDRPATLEEWERFFGPQPKDPDRTDPTPLSPALWHRGRSVLATLGVAIAVIAIITVVYQVRQPTEQDITAMLAKATQTLVAAPFDGHALTSASDLYRETLTLDQDNQKAQSGYDAAQLLKGFNRAIDKPDLEKARAELGKAEIAIQRAGVDTRLLEPGWDRIDVLAAKQSIRLALTSRPLTEDTWSMVTKQLRKLDGLTLGRPLAKAGDLGLSALRSTRAAAGNHDYAAAREFLRQAETHLRAFGLTDLAEVGNSLQSAEQAWRARRNKIEALFQVAAEQLQTLVLNTAALTEVRQTYGKILALEANNPRALAGLEVVKHLAQATQAVAEARFDAGATSVQTAQHKLEAAGLPSDALNAIAQQITEAKAARVTASKRTQTQGLLAQAASVIVADPLAAPARTAAAKDYDQVRELSDGAPALASEADAAKSGLRLLDRLAAIEGMVDDTAFDQARAKLEEPALRKDLKTLGLGPKLAANANQVITTRQIASLYRLAVTGLNKQLLVPEALGEADAQYQHILALRDDEPLARTGRQTVAALQGVIKARSKQTYGLLLEELKALREPLLSLGVSDETLAIATETLHKEQAAWEEQEQARRLSILMADAFRQLNANPYAEAAWQVAARAFSQVAAIDGGAESAALGRQALAGLRKAKQLLEQGAFRSALDTIADVETQSKAFGIETFAKARSLVENAQREDQSHRDAAVQRAVASARQTLTSPSLGLATLPTANEQFQKALALSPDSAEAKTGLQITGALEAFYAALDTKDFRTANEAIRSLSDLVNGDNSFRPTLDLAKRQLTSAEATQRLEQEALGVSQLMQSATARLRDVTFGKRGIAADTLTEVENTLKQAVHTSADYESLRTERDHSLAAIRSIGLLRAIQSQTRRHAFAKARSMLDELQTATTAADLGDRLVTRTKQFVINAEVAWHIDLAADAITPALLRHGEELAEAEEQLTQAQRLQARPEIAAGLQGIVALRTSLAARAGGDYPTALQDLEDARSYLEQLGMDASVCDTLRDALVAEQHRLAVIQQERQISDWMSEAIAQLNATPFDEHTWNQARTLAQRIARLREGDLRATALEQSIDELRPTKAALDRGAAQQAAIHLKRAQAALSQVGLRDTLTSAQATIKRLLDVQFATELEAADQWLSQNPLTVQSCDRAAEHYRRVLAQAGDHPQVQAALSQVQALRNALLAINERRYAAAESVLDNAQRSLAQQAGSDTDLQTLSSALTKTREQLAQLRPARQDIDPVIVDAIKQLSRNPLDTTTQDRVEQLLRQVLQIKADAASAQGGIAIIAQLRLAHTALTRGDTKAAHVALQTAQDRLNKIGLGADALKGAWEALH